MARIVVVGAGAAGCVAAHRLARHGHDVVVVERGPDLTDSPRDRAIDSTDFLAAIAEPGRTMEYALDRSAHRYTVGAGVGGSTAVNAMVVHRGGLPGVATLMPTERVEPDELGVIDRALLSVVPDGDRAELFRSAGRRVTVAEAYLWPVRDHVEVIADTGASRVVFDGNRAVGIALDDERELDADGIVLCAGAIGTPAILLRGGVPTSASATFDRVGRGLQDHPGFVVTLRLREPVEEPGLVTGAVADIDGLQLFPMNRVTSIPSEYGALAVGVMRPQGRGRVQVVDGKTIVAPAGIDHADDRRSMERAVALVHQILRERPFTAVVEAALVGDDGMAFDLDLLRDLDEVLAAQRPVYRHASSTCAIGSVVDDAGAVFGTAGLWVLDASAFPSVPEGNPELATIVQAEQLVSRLIDRGERDGTIG